MDKRYTQDEILALRPCHGTRECIFSMERARAWLAQYWPEGQDSVSVEEIAACEAVSLNDRLWALFRLAPARVARLSACDSAERALSRIPEDKRDSRSIQAIEVARRFALSGASEAELGSARIVAEGAAYNARDAAYRTPTYNSSERALAWRVASVWSAVADATSLTDGNAYEAAYAAACAEDNDEDERQTQLDRLLRIWAEHG